jgi:hypothetical protein
MVIYLINGRTPIFLQTEFGVMLVNEGGAGDPKGNAFERQPPRPRYIIAIRSKRKIIDTTDIVKFKRAIMEIPKGSKIIRYDSCTVSRASHLDWNEFEDVIRSAGLVLPEDPIITCYCAETEKR